MVLLAYIPVLHDGYRRLLQQFAERGSDTRVWLIGEGLSHRERALVKDIRAVPSEVMGRALAALFPKLDFGIADQVVLQELGRERAPIQAPYEEITRSLISEYVPENEIEFVNIFLRWDRENSTKWFPPSPDAIESLPVFIDKHMTKAYQVAAKSSDWWRQVGAAIIDSTGEIVCTAYNHHLPSEQQQYVNGDPRASFQSGVNFELGSSIHAEAAAIGEAARRGLRLQNTTLYTTTYPCPTCAKLIAQAGITTVYFSEGYALLDGETVMKSAGITVVKLDRLA